MYKLHYPICSCVLCWDVSCTKPLFTVPATLEGSGVQVRCEEITYSTELDIATQDIELRVVGNGDRRIDNPQSAKGGITVCEWGVLGMCH